MRINGNQETEVTSTDVGVGLTEEQIHTGNVFRCTCIVQGFWSKMTLMTVELEKIKESRIRKLRKAAGCG